MRLTFGTRSAALLLGWRKVGVGEALAGSGVPKAPGSSDAAILEAHCSRVSNFVHADIIWLQAARLELVVPDASLGVATSYHLPAALLFARVSIIQYEVRGDHARVFGFRQALSGVNIEFTAEFVRFCVAAWSQANFVGLVLQASKI